VFERVVGAGRKGGACARLLVQDGNTGNFAVDGLTSLQFAVDTVCTLSVWAKYVSNGATAPVLACHYNGALFVSTPLTGDGEWHRTSLTWTAPAGVEQVPVPVSDPRTVHTEIFIDGVQFVAEAVASDFMDPDSDPSCAWTSTAHASSSTRAPLSGYSGTLTSFASLGLTIQSRPNPTRPDSASGCRPTPGQPRLGESC